MQPDLSTFGVALLCDQTGTVLKVLYNEFGLSEADMLGKSFPQLVDISSLHKALSFLVELRTNGSLMGWELNVHLNGKMVLAHCAGLVFEDQLLIMAARTQTDIHHLFNEMMRMNNEQMNLLRQITKDQIQTVRTQPEYDNKHYDDLTRLNNELVTLQRELTRKNIELERLNAEVQRLAITDSLTGLYNRRGFFELSQREVERAKRFGRPFSVIMLDIDHFKSINDTYGHEAGDQVLEKVTARLRDKLRTVDIVGRYGGEEFSILLPESEPAGALEAGERLRRCIADELIETSQGILKVTISLGLTTLTDNSKTLEELLKFADQALYQAKEAGRNRVCAYGE